MCVDLPGQGFDLLAIAADHAFPVGIDDQQVSLFPANQGLLHLCRRGVDDTEKPVDLFPLFQTPDLARRLAFTGKFFGEQRRLAEPLRHAVTVLPGAEGEESGRLAEAVATHRLGFDAEAAHQVTDCGPEGNLADDQGVVIVVQRFVQLRFPEMLRQKLAGQEVALTILVAVDGRPPGREIAPHAGEMVPGAGEDERHLAPWCQRFGSVKHAVADAG